MHYSLGAIDPTGVAGHIGDVIKKLQVLNSGFFQFPLKANPGQVGLKEKKI